MDKYITDFLLFWVLGFLLGVLLVSLIGCSTPLTPSPSPIGERKEKERAPFFYSGSCEDFRFIAPPSSGVCEVVGQ